LDFAEQQIWVKGISIFPAKTKAQNIYKFCKSCSSSHKEHRKIGFAIFGFFSMILYGFYRVQLKHSKG
jgi:cytochrome c1